MGVGSILRFFLPHDDKFLPYFEQSADNLKEASGVYASLSKSANHDEIAVVREEIKKLEHVGDKLTHTIFEELNRSFITPFDREDIHRLASSLDDVLDFVYAAGERLVIYKINRPPKAAAELAGLIVQQGNALTKGVQLLEKNGDIMTHCVEVNDRQR